MIAATYLAAMEPLLETITLDSEESADLAFKIKIEGTAPAPAKVRLVCECDDVSYMFNGRGTSDEGVVQFTVPQMKDKLNEGTYPARVEVLIENRYFAPVQFQINFKKALKVVAESFKVMPQAQKQEIKVTAVPIVIEKPLPKVESRPIVVEEAPKPKAQQVPTQVPMTVKPQSIVTVPVPKPKTPVQKSATSTLKERFESKTHVKELGDDEEESVVREIARNFIRSMKRR